MIVISYANKILGKTRMDPALLEGFELTPFDAGIEAHKKAKFLTEVPTVFVKISNPEKPAEGLTSTDWLISLRDACHFYTAEAKTRGEASNSEIRRWLKNGAVWVNGEPLLEDEPMNFPVFSVVLFPRSERRCTLL